MCGPFGMPRALGPPHSVSGIEASTAGDTDGNRSPLFQPAYGAPLCLVIAWWLPEMQAGQELES